MTTRKVEFGLVLPVGPPRSNASLWQTNLDAVLPDLADVFRSLWMTDHFFWGDQPTHEVWTVLAFAAARWPQFEIGPMVLGQSYRNPALLAKMGATLQALTDGRFIMAVGAGWKEDEYRAYGYPYPRAGIRVAQLEDTLEIITRLWTEPGQVTYTGRHYQIREAYCEPKPDPRPKIIVGGGGRKTMMLAARFADWWNMPDAHIDDYADRVAILHEHCRTIGRDPQTMRLTWFGRLAVAESEVDAERLSQGKWTSRNALVGTPDQVVAQLERFIDLGVDYFMVDVLGLEGKRTRQLLVDDVLGAIR